MALTQIDEGSVAWAGTMNANIAFLRLPTAFISGLKMSYTDTSHFQVSAGACRDSTDTKDIVLSSAVAVNALGSGAAASDAFGGPGTASCTSAGTSFSGSSTTFLTSFGPNSTPRALFSCTFTNGSATVTNAQASGSGFLGRIAVNDLIGNTTVGYRRVSAISSDTSLTTSATFGTTSTSTGNALEAPTIQIGSNGIKPLDSITSNTAGTIVGSFSNTNSGVAYTIGYPLAASGAYYAWVGSGASGTTAYASTQRTTTYGVTGYSTNVRRIGTLTSNSVQEINPFVQTGSGNDRFYQVEIVDAASGTRLLSAGAATSWTRIVASGFAPPVATRLAVTLFLYNPVGGNSLALRATGVGPAGTHNLYTAVAAGGRCASQVIVPIDGAGAFDYLIGSADANVPAYIDAYGYEDSV